MAGNTCSKKIIVCCDGTAHSAIKGNDLNPYTNVLRLSRCINARDAAGCPQIVGYVSGIGTSDGNPVNTYLQGTGIGIDEKIKEAYNFICHNYEHDDAAERTVEIFLIGFSRGAFVARCVADLVTKIGVLTKAGTHYLPYVYDLWQRNRKTFHDILDETVTAPSPPTGGLGRKAENEKNREEFTNDLRSILTSSIYVRRRVHIKVCAVWDTVASLGGVSTHLGIFRHWKSRKLNFVDSNLCDGIDHAIQALSLHEHRRPFCPIVWKLPNGSQEGKRNNKPRLQQCWFMGYHSDIGGGRRGEGLAHFPLAWMMSKLETFLDFDRGNFWNPRPIEINWRADKAEHPASSAAKIKINVKDSMSKRYWLAGSHYRKPVRHFWLSNPKTYRKPQEGSYETLHFTVRLLNNIIEPSKMMKGAIFENENENENGQWRFQVLPAKSLPYRLRTALGRADYPKVEYQVKEDTLNESEAALMLKWIRGELEALYEEHGHRGINRRRARDDYKPGFLSFLTILQADVVRRDI